MLLQTMELSREDDDLEMSSLWHQESLLMLQRCLCP
jgi:hypothetical protein